MVKICPIGILSSLWYVLVRSKHSCFCSTEYPTTDCAIYNNLFFIAQPTGWISVINLDTDELVTEFEAFTETDENFHWSNIAVNSNIIACASETTIKIFYHDGNIAFNHDLGGSRLVLDEEKLMFVGMQVVRRSSVQI